MEWFLKDCVTLKTGVKADENSDLHHWNKLLLNGSVCVCVCVYIYTHTHTYTLHKCNLHTVSKTNRLYSVYDPK